MGEAVGSTPTEGSMRVWSNGLASGFQPEDASSILATRSRSNALLGVHSLGENTSQLLFVDPNDAVPPAEGNRLQPCLG